jgi:hypothetical protein
MTTSTLSPPNPDPALEVFTRAANLPELDGYRLLAFLLRQLELSEKDEDFKDFRERVARADLSLHDREQLYELFKRPLPAEATAAAEAPAGSPAPSSISRPARPFPARPPRPFSTTFVGKSIFGTKPEGEGGPRDFYVGWGAFGAWQQRGPLTRAGAVRLAAEMKMKGFAPYFHAPQLGDQWHPVGKLLPTE